jgi:APA family basic amino acid/polyamine antiporter
MSESKVIELRRDLGLWGAISIVVGTVIGSGIFLVPRAMVLRVGSPSMVFVVWIFGGLLSLCGALSYAELAAAMPEAGGEYVYLREAYGPLWGFLYGWTQMWVAKSGSIATLATAFFYYLTNFFPLLDGIFYTVPLPLGAHGAPLDLRYGQLLAMALILFLAAVNYFGVKIGGEVQIIVTIVKVLLIAFIVIAGLGFGKAHAMASAPMPHALSVAGFFGALVAALWAYDGWNNVSMVASEIRQPQRSLPLALIGGTLAVIAIYLAANAAYFHVLSAQEVGSSQRVAADMMRRVVGSWGANAVSVAAMISIFAALNGSILTGARVPYAMARDGRFFAPVAQVSAAYHTPGVSILALSLWSCAVGFVRTLRAALHLRYLCKLDSIWHDYSGSYRTPAQETRSAAALQNDSLSRTSGTLRARSNLASTLDPIRLSPRISAWVRFHPSWSTFLFLLGTAPPLMGHWFHWS